MVHHPTPGHSFLWGPVSGGDRWTLAKVRVVFREFVVSFTRLEMRHFPFLKFLVLSPARWLDQFGQMALGCVSVSLSRNDSRLPPSLGALSLFSLAGSVKIP